MRGLKYAFNEAASSLLRGWRSAAFAVLTIAAGLFVLGFFLALNANLQRIVSRWGDAAELSVFLADGASTADRQAIEEAIDRSGLSAQRQYVSKSDAALRFTQEFPDLASVASRLDHNPLPASIEVRLKPDVQSAGDVVDRLAGQLATTAGVADVRYDRRWLARLHSVVRIVRGVGLLIVAMLAIAAALTVANVVRLAAHARRHEIEIMQLVGAPLAYVRGPFVMEGVLQGGVGALLALLTLWGVFLVGRVRYGMVAAEVLGLGTISFLPAGLWALLLLGGMALGCIGGMIVARGVR